MLSPGFLMQKITVTETMITALITRKIKKPETEPPIIAARGEVSVMASANITIELVCTRTSYIHVCMVNI